MISRILKTVFIFFLLFLTFNTKAYSQSFPQYEGYVNDFANILDKETKNNLELQLREYEQKTTNEIAVATVSSLDDFTVDDYASRLFEKWKIGKKNKDNGILLLVAPNDRKVRIEVGYGLEGVLNDAKAGRIIDEYILPSFKAGSYSEGITKGVGAILQVIGGEELPVQQKNTNQDDNGWIFSLFIFGSLIVQYLASFLGRTKEIWPGAVIGGVTGLILGLILKIGFFTLLSIGGMALFGLLMDYYFSRNYQERAKKGLSNTWMSSGGGFFSGGGSSGGGSSGFGGGSSGGGGASRGW